MSTLTRNIIIVIVLVFLLLGLGFGICYGIYSMEKAKLPRYKILSTNGTSISNRDWEVAEQITLGTYLKDGDRVLQLGGNIGGSCITASKMFNLTRNTCVEPNPKIISTLRRNVSDTNANVEIVDAAVTDSSKSLFLDEGTLNGPNSSGGMVKESQSEIPVNKVPLRVLENKGKAYNVLFADCEGCLPSFLKEYSYHPWDLVIYEPDQDADYAFVERHLKGLGMKKVSTLELKLFNLTGNHVKVWKHPLR